jgi:hypothetical protein
LSRSTNGDCEENSPAAIRLASVSSLEPVLAADAARSLKEALTSSSSSTEAAESDTAQRAEKRRA